MQIHDTNGHLKHDDEWSKKNSWPINVDKKMISITELFLLNGVYTDC